MFPLELGWDSKGVTAGRLVLRLKESDVGAAGRRNVAMWDISRRRNVAIVPGGIRFAVFPDSQFLGRIECQVGAAGSAQSESERFKSFPVSKHEKKSLCVCGALYQTSIRPCTSKG